MLNIGFILPPDTGNFKPFRNQPLTSLYLMTILEEKFKDSLELTLIDLRGIREDCIKYYLPEMDAYFYTVMSQEFHAIRQIKKTLSEMYPKAMHVAGGVHINIFPEDNLETFDSIVIGEGEETIIEIVDDLCNNNLKPIYKEEKLIDLDSYPYPSRKYLPKPAIVDTGLLGGDYLELPATNVLFSRGCPFQCSFCANVNFGPTRFRSPRLVADEIEYLKKEYGIKGLALKDDNAIPLSTTIARPFLEAIGSANIKWRGQSRANGISEDMVKLAADAGCTDIGIGIESVCTDSLKSINKKIDLQKAKEYIRTLRKHGIGARLHLIFGLPGEAEDIVSQTLDFIDEAEPTSVLLNLLCPLPGSDMYNDPKSFGIKNMSHQWHKLRNLYSRFDEEEKPHMWFEYESVTPWGRSMTNEKIIANYSQLQAILRERNLNF